MLSKIVYTINLATGKVIASYDMTQVEQISQIVNNARIWLYGYYSEYSQLFRIAPYAPS